MTREEQILEARSHLKNSVQEYGFSLGAEWADKFPETKTNHFQYREIAEKQIKTLEQQLAIAMEFINKQAEYECYVMCGCQDDAKEALAKIKELEAK